MVEHESLSPEMRLLPRSELKNAICYAYIRNWHHILIAVAERSPALLFGWHKRIDLPVLTL